MTASESELAASLRNLDACAVSDACDRLGLQDRVVTGIVPLAGPTRVAGRIVTVRLGPPQSGAANAPRHLCAAAVDAATPDDVIVVDHQGRRDCAGWGGLLSRAARLRGCAGTLVDGAARDVDEALAMGYALFAAGATPRTARGRAVEVSWGESIVFGGIAVHHGDYVIADLSGVVFVPALRAAEVVAVAAAICATESAMATDIAGGRTAGDVMGTSYEAMLTPTDADK